MKTRRFKNPNNPYQDNNEAKLIAKRVYEANKDNAWSGPLPPLELCSIHADKHLGNGRICYEAKSGTRPGWSELLDKPYVIFINKSNSLFCLLNSELYQKVGREHLARRIEGLGKEGQKQRLVNVPEQYMPIMNMKRINPKTFLLE